MASIAEQIAALLEEAWNKPQKKPEDVWFYQRVLGTKFVEFIGNMETALRTLVGRLRTVEQQQLKIFKVLNLAEPAAEAPATSANGGQQQQQQPSRSRAPAGLVRVDSMGNEMSPEDQDAEERADIMTDGVIDKTRYVPRGSAPPPQMMPSQPSAPPPPPMTQTPTESAGVVSANPNGQQ